MAFKMKGFPMHSEASPMKQGGGGGKGAKGKSKKYEIKGSSDAAMHARAARYADERYEKANQEWKDGGMKGPAPKRSDFTPTWGDRPK